MGSLQMDEDDEISNLVDLHMYMLCDGWKAFMIYIRLQRKPQPLFKALIAQEVADALAERDANISRNGDDIHDSGSDGRRRMPVARECTYNDFLKCQPLNFKGTEGVEMLLRVEHPYTGGGEIVTHEVAYEMTWKTLKTMITDKYCPRGEIKKLEIEMWNMKVKGTYVVSYNQHYQELSLMCSRMFLEESDEIEKYVGGLPDMIHGSVMASKPKTMQDAIEFATKLMDQKIRTITERQTEYKRKLDDNSSDNNAQQPPFKRQNVARAYSARPSEKKEYVGTLPLCNKCKLYHNGTFIPGRVLVTPGSVVVTPGSYSYYYW
ncbi:hypothetical protein Tco_0895854 [Tanacetum coccineum]|uniref:Retrotransposon gag domain-containing protein n=1 Tax=Tanacetum coccineum TaxID=301880 RepID=A0ABQ5CHW2_9ASTR